MKAFLRAASWWLVLAALGCVGLRATAATVRMLAASSLTDVLKEVGGIHERRTGDVLVFQFGASGLLARQIEAGAPADLFVSADDVQMDSLDAKGWIVAGTRRSLISNRLVLVTASDSALKLDSLAGLGATTLGRLAVPDPKLVPLGRYARRVLELEGAWSAVERRVIPTESARATLAAVESGNVDAGIVFATDARGSKRVRVVLEIPVRSEVPIRYPAALVKGAASEDAARRFLDWLGTEEASRIFERHGFIVLGAATVGSGRTR